MKRTWLVVVAVLPPCAVIGLWVMGALGKSPGRLDPDDGPAAAAASLRHPEAADDPASPPIHRHVSGAPFPGSWGPSSDGDPGGWASRVASLFDAVHPSPIPVGGHHGKVLEWIEPKASRSETGRPVSTRPVETARCKGERGS